MRILTEASGSLVGGFLIKAIQSVGHEAIASDIDPYSVGRYLADEFVQMPKSTCPNLWEEVGIILEDLSIDLVIPSFDETLIGWAQSLYAVNRPISQKSYCPL